MPYGPAARRQREEEGRDPDRERRGQGQVARQQRVLGRGQSDREDQECGERGLGDEELGHALQVTQHLPALGDHRRDRPEVAAHEHDVGDAARDLGAAALRDGESRGLERGDVVDAVADHRDVAPVRGQRLHDPPLVLRCDAPDDHAGAERLEQLGGVLRKRAAVEGRPVGRDACVGCDRAHGLGPVAGEHAQLDPLLEEPGHRVARPGPQPLGEHGEAEHGRARGRRLVAVDVVQRGRFREREHAAARRRLGVRARGELAEVEQLGRPEHERAAVEHEPAPAATGRERNAQLRRLRLRRKLFRQREQRRVRARVAGGVAASARR